MKSLKLIFTSLKRGFLNLNRFLNKIMNFILLSIVYFIGIGLTSIIAKIFKKRFLEIKKTKNTNTYWTSLDLKKKSLEEYYRQF